MSADDHQKLREKVAAEYGIALYRRYREKQAAQIVGYEAAWWKRHRKAGTIAYVEDPGGNIAYFGYMLCDLLILGKGAITRRKDYEGDAATAADPQPKPLGGPGIAAEMMTGERKEDR